MDFFLQLGDVAECDDCGSAFCVGRGHLERHRAASAASSTASPECAVLRRLRDDGGCPRAAVREVTLPMRLLLLEDPKGWNRFMDHREDRMAGITSKRLLSVLSLHLSEFWDYF